MRRYDEYKFSIGELIAAVITYLSVLALTSYFFYRSVLFFLIGLIGIIFYLKIDKKQKIRKTKKKLAEEFAEVLNSVNANVKAGYALENAFVEAYNDMVSFYGDKSLMAEEIIYIKKGLSVNQTLESMLSDLGKRSGVEDILVFSRVFETAKRNGGNIKEVLEKTSETVKAKSEVEKEIEVMISQRKLELSIMECIPFFIIAYIGITSKGYFSVLYHNLRGILLMSVCLSVYIIAIYIGSKMVNINV